MAALTGYNILITSEVRADSGRRVSIAEGGQIRGRNTFEKSVYSIHFVIHTDLTGKAALDTFYVTNSDSLNTVTIDDRSYTWLFVNEPEVTEKDGLIRIVEFDAIGHIT